MQVLIPANSYSGIKSTNIRQEAADIKGLIMVRVNKFNRQNKFKKINRQQTGSDKQPLSKGKISPETQTSARTATPSLFLRLYHYYFNPDKTVRRKNRISSLQTSARFSVLICIALIIFASVRNIIRLKHASITNTHTLPNSGIKNTPAPIKIRNSSTQSRNKEHKIRQEHH
ncbi:hypothetical protein BGH94_04275 [Snodgrassella alvi]|nr:hypothetical protein BGH94_04275 [Snodgrassella alvi]ORF04462.1 hypothetical protein BGH95_01150 [Snodgrassella alvi]